MEEQSESDSSSRKIGESFWSCSVLFISREFKGLYGL